MYKSPIDIVQANILKNIVEQTEAYILQEVRNFGVIVDKEELIHALNYDRCQYEEGYLDGKTDAMDELVHCRDCKYYNVFRLECHNGRMNGVIGIDGYCSYGERRSE